MQTLNFVAGTSVVRAARLLAAHAPARGVFNGIPMRARYATTRPEDIVRQWTWDHEIRRIVYRASPQGIADQAAAVKAREEAQARIDASLGLLPTLDFSDLPAVLSWIEGLADAVEHTGTVYNHASIVATFTAAGWHPSVNTGADFDINDADNYARWIVGQWLETEMALVMSFIAKWREKFQGASA